jgi:hypothetical protein
VTIIEQELRKYATDRWPHPDWDAPFSTVYFLGSPRVFARNLPGAGGVEVWKLFHLGGTPPELITGVAQLHELLAAKGITHAARPSQESRGAATAINRRLGSAPGENLP